MADRPYLPWPVFRRSEVAGFDRSLTSRSPSIVADVISNDFAPNGRVFAIVLDDLHLDGWKTTRVRRLAREFVEHHVGPDDLVLLAATSGRAHLTQEFTTDKGRVLQAIDGFVGLADGPVNQEESTHNTRSVLATLENLARHFAGLRGRRTAIIFISEAYGLPEPGSGEFPGSLGRSASDVITGHFKAIEALRNSNVTLYSIDPRGLDEEAMKEKESRETLHELAGATGALPQP